MLAALAAPILLGSLLGAVKFIMWQANKRVPKAQPWARSFTESFPAEPIKGVPAGTPIELPEALKWREK